MSAQKIKHAGEPDRLLWDEYIQRHVNASLFHLFGWRNVFHRTYGHATHYLMAVGGEVGAQRQSLEVSADAASRVLGVLPLVHFKNAIFGNRLVSLPFVDGGGILASDREAEEILLSEAIALGRELGADTIELRQERPLASIKDGIANGAHGSRTLFRVTRRTDKVRMLLNLPESSGMLLGSFKSKLRSQINKPLKERFASSIGGLELLQDFYQVFLVNMRDLGSPVHSMELMRNVLAEFPERSRIIVIYGSKEPVAAAVVAGSGTTLRNPWASSLRKYAPFGPNMLLYLRMLEHACDSGYRVFDFGRSTPGEGTYRFKEQWGAEPEPLHWHNVLLDGRPDEVGDSSTEHFRMASRYWRKLPLIVTRVIGPRIRKHISL